MKLRICEEHYGRLKQSLCRSFWPGRQPETGCILLVAVNDYEQNPSLLVADVLVPRPGDFVKQGPSALCFGSHYLRRALLSVRERGLAGFLTVHTHPFATDRVSFSLYDDASDPELMANLLDLQPEGTFGSIVAGASTMAARLWNSKGEWSKLEEMIIVGESIRSLPLDGLPWDEVNSPSTIFDKGLPLTGRGALSLLSRMRIGVVGDSGTGSLMIELLVRAGVGEIVIFEFDKADRRNLNRVLHMRVRDAESGRPKAERTAEVVAESGLPTRITLVPGGDIRDPDVAGHLHGCDVLFGCVDRDWPRLILCEVAYQFLIPLIDLGSEIGINKNELQSLDTRVSYIAPNRPCLICGGIVKTERIALEGHSGDELDRILSMGYNEDIRLDSPAVMELNMRAAAQASLLLRHLLQPFLATPLPHSIRDSLTNFSTRGTNAAFRAGCMVCGFQERLGSGCRFPLTTRKS